MREIFKEKQRNLGPNEQRKCTLEHQEIEAAKKRKELDTSGMIVQKIDFSIESPSTSNVFISEPSCSSDFYHGGEETIVHELVDKSTSTEDFEVVGQGSSNSETQTAEFGLYVCKLYLSSSRRIIL